MEKTTFIWKKANCQPEYKNVSKNLGQSSSSPHSVFCIVYPSICLTHEIPHAGMEFLLRGLEIGPGGREGERNGKRKGGWRWERRYLFPKWNSEHLHFTFFFTKRRENYTLGGIVHHSGPRETQSIQTRSTQNMWIARRYANKMDIKWMNAFIIGHNGENQLFWIIKHISRTLLLPIYQKLLIYQTLCRAHYIDKG